MPQFIPVDNDPFAVQAPKFVPVDHDPFAPQSSTLADVTKSGGTGLVQGVTGLAGMPADVQNLGHTATTGILRNILNFTGATDQSTWDNYDKDQAQNLADIQKSNPEYAALMKAQSGQGLTSQNIDNGVQGAFGNYHQPETTAGQYANTIGKFLPGAALGGGTSIPSLLKYGVLPAVASETAGQVTQGSSAEPYARALAAVLSPSLANGAKRIVTPLPVSSERMSLVNALKGEGVDLTAGQVTGNTGLKYAESLLGDSLFSGGKAGDVMDAQKGQYTAAALRRVGTDSTSATPLVLADTKATIGQQFNDLTARNSLQIDDGLKSSLDGIASNYQDSVLPSQQSPMVKNTLRDIYGEAQPNATDAVPATPATRTPVLGPDGQTVRYDTTPAVDGTPANAGDFTGEMAGTRYQDIRSRLSKQADAVALSDPQTSQALKGIKTSLDDAMTRSISPEDASAWADARSKWANWKVIEKAATGAGSETALGSISPSQLRNAIVAQNRGAYATGNGDFANLARAGEAILKPLPNSGTAQREAITALSGGTGAALGSLFGGAGGGASGALAGAIAPAVLGRALMSKPTQAYLANQLMNSPSTATPLLVKASMLANALAERRNEKN